MAVFYSVIFFLSLWVHVQEKTFLFPQKASGQTLGLHLMCGILAAGFILLFGIILNRSSNRFRKLSQDMASLLEGMSVSDFFALAAFSSIAEECLFRGVLQANIGLLASAFLFGIAHMGFGKRGYPWMFFAFGSGLVLGGLYQSTENLLAPILAHFIVNFVNLYRLRENAKNIKNLTPHPENNTQAPDLFS